MGQVRFRDLYAGCVVRLRKNAPSAGDIQDMQRYLGKTATISKIYNSPYNYFHIVEDDGYWSWCIDDVEYIAEDPVDEFDASDIKDPFDLL